MQCWGTNRWDIATSLSELFAFKFSPFHANISALSIPHSPINALIVTVVAIEVVASD